MHLQVYQGWKKARMQPLEPYVIYGMHIYPFLVSFIPLIAGSNNGPISLYCMPHDPFAMGFMVYAPLVIHCLFCIGFMGPVVSCDEVCG